MMAAAGYPGLYEKGSIIKNIDAVRGAKVIDRLAVMWITLQAVIWP